MTDQSLPPDDLSRDLDADLAVIHAATPGLIQDGCAVGIPIDPVDDPYGCLGYQDVAVFSVWDKGECVQFGVAESPHRHNAAFFVAARDGWEIAIRRAKAAEAKLKIFNTFLAAVLSLEPHSTKPMPHVEALLDWVDRAQFAETALRKCLKDAHGLPDVEATLAVANVSWAERVLVAEAEVERLRTENVTLRTLLAKLPQPCIYCGLDDMSRCVSGFPGCAKADDIICGEDEAFKSLVAERIMLRNRLAELEDTP